MQSLSGQEVHRAYFPKAREQSKKIQSIMIRTYDYLGDPRIGPALLLGSLMSFGSIWLMRSKQNRPVQSSQPSEADDNVGDGLEYFLFYGLQVM